MIIGRYPSVLLCRTSGLVNRVARLATQRMALTATTEWNFEELPVSQEHGTPKNNLQIFPRAILSCCSVSHASFSQFWDMHTA